MIERVRSVLVGTLAIAVAFALGATVILSASGFVPPLFAALVAAIACRRPLDAAIAAVAGAVLGTLAADVASMLPWTAPSVWVPMMLQSAVIAGVLAAAMRLAVERAPRTRALLEVLALAVLVSAMCQVGIRAAVAPSSDGTTLAQALRTAPAIVRSSPDEVLFMNVLHRLDAGEPYYRAYAEVIAEADRVRPGVDDPTSPLAYRMPTLYRLLTALPGGGISLVFAMLGCGTLAAVSAFALGRHLSGTPLALAGSAAVAALYGSFAHSPALLYTEPWAGAIGLAALALLIAPRTAVGSKRWLLVSGSAMLALAAALVRDLAVAFILVGLAASLLSPESRRSRLWVPWLAALGVFAVAYGAHWMSALRAGQALGVVPASVQRSWLHPDGSGLAASVVRYAYTVGVKPVVGWAMLAAAAVSALIARPARPTRLVLAAVVFGGGLVLAIARPEGVSSVGTVPGYWGDLLLPVALACAPSVLAVLSRSRYGEAEAQAEEGSEVGASAA